MIIKRWNSGASAFVEEHPKTKAQLVFNNGNTESIFDVNDQIKVKYLPQYVFDNLSFWGTKGGNYNLTALLYDMWDDLALWNQSLEFIRSQLMGKYIVQSSSGTITAHPTTTQTVTGGSGTYYGRTFLAPTDGGTNLESATTDILEAGDWLVIVSVGSGNGTSSGSFVSVQFSVVNNVYELATTAIDGIVRLSSRSTYAGLTGNNVVTEGVLKTVIDQASFAASGHVHGNVLNDGTITTNTAAASGQHLVVTSSGNLIQQSAIELGTSTTTFLNNAGAWSTPIGTTYSAGEGLTLSSTTFRMTYPLFVQTTTPTTTIAGAIWYDIN